MKRIVLSFLFIIMVMASACSGKAGDKGTGDKKTEYQNISMDEIRDRVAKAYGEDYIPNMPYDAASLKELFGIKEEWYEEYAAEGPMISAQVDTFIGIKAKSGKSDEVEKALKQYREALVADTMQYPSNQVKIQASQVVSYGDYVFFLMLGNIPMKEEEQGEEAMLKAFEEQNGIAIKAIEEILIK